MAGTYMVSSSTSDRIYAVELKEDGSAACECLAWRYSKGPRKDAVCKHIRQIRGELAAA